MKRWTQALVALWVALASALAVGPATAGTVPPSSAGTPQLSLFRSGSSGYGCFRIPALVRTKAGSLLAFAEGRKAAACPDRGDNDLVVRRSTDNGRTWGPITVIPDAGVAAGSLPAGPVPPGTGDGSRVTRGSASPVVDSISGRIYLLSSSNPADASYPRSVWSQYSTDDGLTWGDPVKLPESDVTLHGTGFDGGFFTTGPGHGVQLTEGQHPGRLVVSANQNRSGVFYGGYLYLDPADASGSWKAAQAVPSATQPTEIGVAEAPGGNVQLIARSSPSRVAALSATPADSTVPSVPAFTGDGIPSYGDVMGSLLRLHRAADGKEQLLLAAPAGPSRSHMTIHSRCGSGTSAHWSAGGTQITATPSGYSDLALLASQEIGLLYEGGADDLNADGTGNSADEIRFTRLSEAALDNPCGISPRVPTGTTAGSAPAPSTPDVSGGAHDALMYPGSALGSGNLSGGLDRSLALTGSGYTEVPYSPALVPGTGDFTYSLWFRCTFPTGATPPDRTLLWTKGVWLRVRPGSSDLYATVTGSAGTSAAASPADPSGAAYGDGGWHHATLTRTGGSVTVAVDGSAGTPGAGVSGAVPADPAAAPSGLRVGGRPDTSDPQPFAGDIDEVRLYGTALTAAESSVIGTRLTAAGPVGDAADGALALRLPFQVVDNDLVPSRTEVDGLYDESGNCTDAWLQGGRGSTTTRKDSGQALIFDSAHPGVVAPQTPALELGAGDFTASLWFYFRPTSDDSAQAVLWGYGMNTQPQLWIQAQPPTRTDSASYITAAVRTDSGTTATATVSAEDFATTATDPTWLQAVLTRSGGALTLRVYRADSTPPQTATASGLSGSLTAPPPAQPSAGLRIGVRSDGGKVLNGGVDEFRLFRSALSAADLAMLHGNSLNVSVPPVVRYSFDTKFAYEAQDVRQAARTSHATPDTSGRCNHAYLLGGAHVAATSRTSVDGTATDRGSLSLPGSGGLLVPRNASVAVPVDDPEFTISLWFRYDAPTAASPPPADQVLLWAYGTGPDARQLWVRASPSGDALSGALAIDRAQIRFTAPDAGDSVAFGDGDWHELTLVRDAASFQVYVDAHPAAATAPLPAGGLTVTNNHTEEGLHFGSEPDGSQPFSGSLDNVRLFHTPLTPAQVTSLHETDTAPSGLRQDLFLPFDLESDQTYPAM
jgi:sialidase-1